MGFAKTKDRAFTAYETVSGWLARRGAPVRHGVYGSLGGALWLPYLTPRSAVRQTMTALADQVGGRSPSGLFRQYVKRFIRGTELAERVRHGYGSELDGMLHIPEKARLDAMLADRGIFLAMPHLHASLAMVRCLSQSYPVLAVVSLTRDPKRAQAQRRTYEQGDCEVLDVRSETPAAVARQILKALKSGKIVAGTVDRIQTAPNEPFDKRRDVIRATPFGVPAGFGAWPTRFAAKAGAPIMPAMVEQTETGLNLILGQGTVPTEDLVTSTQVWVDELERLLRTYPEEWTFSLDKHWMRVLTTAHAR